MLHARDDRYGLHDVARIGLRPLEAENLELKARLLEIESKLDTVDRELRRLRLYEEQLHAIDPEELDTLSRRASATGNSVARFSQRSTSMPDEALEVPTGEAAGVDVTARSQATERRSSISTSSSLSRLLPTRRRSTEIKHFA